MTQVKLKFIFLLTIATIGLFPTAFAQKDKTSPNEMKEIPLIDRELFFDNPEVTGAQISPDGKWMSFRKPYNGVMNIWVKKIEQAFSEAKPLTAEKKRPVSGYFWAYNSQYVLFVKDNEGDENFHVYAVKPEDLADAMTGVPTPKNLTDAKGATAQIYSVSKKNPNIMHVGLNDRDAAWHDLYEVNIATGARKLLRKNEDRITGWVFDWDENIRFATRSNEDGSSDIMRVEKDALVNVYQTSVFEEAYIAGFTPDNKRAYMVTNKGEGNFSRLVLLDSLAEADSLIEADPLELADIDDVRFSDVSKEMLYTSYTDAKNRLYFKDKDFEADYDLLKEKFSGKEIRFTSSDAKEQKWLFSVFSDTDPGEVYFFDRKTKKTVFQYRPRPKLNPELLAYMETISYTSSDGLRIPAYLTTPRGKEAKKLPLIVMPHGGPWARDYWGYNPYAQFFANRGYAVLQMNFRGSTGLGKAFLDAGNGEWGQKMQDDITWGVKYLINSGVADANKVAIMGGSYGGYATLAGVTFTPDLYKAAIDIVGPSNLITLLETIPAYWEAGRKIMYARMADPTTPEGNALLQAQSPLNSVNKIKTPLMVVQGANDPRVKKAESDQIVKAMKAKNLPVEYLCAPDEGHGFQRPVNNMAFIAAAEKFFATYLGGRYQESMTPDVRTRLSEITVDVSKMATEEDAGFAADTIAFEPAKMANSLTDGSTQYKSTLSMNGQTLAMDMKRTISTEAGNWIIKESTKSSKGEVNEFITINKQKLAAIKKEVLQGSMKMTVEYADKEAKTNMSFGGRNQTASFPLKSAILPINDAIIAALPLKEGYHAIFSDITLDNMQSATYQLSVIGKEKITVAAGTFDAYIVEVKTVDSETTQKMWIANGKAVKIAATIQELGNAKLVTELQ